MCLFYTVQCCHAVTEIRKELSRERHKIGRNDVSILLILGYGRGQLLLDQREDIIGAPETLKHLSARVDSA